MYNVACIDSNQFSQMADGYKTNEVRPYWRPDNQLERVVSGEPILFLEIGSNRALLSRILSIRRIAVHRPTSPTFIIYVIRISQNRRVIELPITRTPGWFRQSKNDLAHFRALRYEKNLCETPE